MEVAAARQLAREWVETHCERWPGLRPAHLVGGITAMADDAPEAERPAAAEQPVRVLRLIGIDTAETRAARWDRATALHAVCLDLADDIVTRHPAVVG